MNNHIFIGEYSKSFIRFLFVEKKNRIALLLSGIAIIIQFAVFKYLYPYANYIHGDSFAYLESAQKNLSANTYLIGYSKFLRLFSVFSTSDFVLAFFQYIFIQLSVLFLVLTFFFFYKPGKISQLLLLAILVLNPLFLHLGNLVSSDGLFLGLSVLWFGSLIWIMHAPSKLIIITHTSVLFLAFTVRYNAMIYPLISVVAFCLSTLPFWKKFTGALFGILFCASFVFYTSYQFKTITGHWQYSPFSGWQFANNAMYAYRYVDAKERVTVPKQFEELDKMIRSYFDSTRDTKKFPIEKIQASTFYMWSPGMPLMDYKYKKFKNDTTSSELRRWASMGPLYKAYGLYIIKHYPLHFARYFIWPNFQKYYAPPVEFLEIYNSGRDGVTDQAKEWFHYKSIYIKTRMKNEFTWALNPFPVLSGIINVLILFDFLCFLSLRRFWTNKNFTKGIILGMTLWILNAAFTITASPAALRFQSFPIIMNLIIVLLLTDWLVSLFYIFKQQSKDNVTIPLKTLSEIQATI